MQWMIEFKDSNKYTGNSRWIKIKEIIPKNFSELIKEKNPQIKESKRALTLITSERHCLQI